ncbi:hypothetical protein JCM9803A_01760 [Rhodococcus erythropolis]
MGPLLDERSDVSKWTLGLSGQRASEQIPEWLGGEADRVRDNLGDGAVDWALEVGADIATRISEAIPALNEGASPLAAVQSATTSTALQALTLIAGIGEPDSALASAEVREIARDFARRGMELDALLRAIRVGYAVLAAALLDAATQLVPPDECSAELRRISVLLFEELDDFTGVAASAFLDEQSIWAAGVSAGQLELVSKIIDDEFVDPLHAEQVLGYPLGGCHLAMIVWSGPHSKYDLRSVVDPVLRRWGTPTATLVIPVGLQALWAWGTIVPDPARALRGPIPDLGEVSVVVGELHTGFAGMRHSHLEARAVERLVRLKSSELSTFAAHEDVALEVLLLSDVAQASRFVTRVLGPLADDDMRMADLRSTLKLYLDMDHSLAKVAAVEHVSRNTVTYRVQKALAMCAHTNGSTTDLRAALRIHNWLEGAFPLDS